MCLPIVMAHAFLLLLLMSSQSDHSCLPKVAAHAFTKSLPATSQCRFASLAAMFCEVYIIYTDNTSSTACGMLRHLCTNSRGHLPSGCVRRSVRVSGVSRSPCRTSRSVPYRHGRTQH